MIKEAVMDLGIEKIADAKSLAAGGLLGAGLGAAGMNLKRRKDLRGKNKQIIKAMQNGGLPTMADLKNDGRTVDDFNILPSDVADSYSPKGGVPIGEDTFGEVYRANYKKNNIPVSKGGKEVSPSIENFRDRLTKNNGSPLERISKGRRGKEKELINNTLENKLGDNMEPIMTDGFGNSFLVDKSKENSPVYNYSHDANEVKEFAKNKSDFKKKLTKEGMKKIAFNPERGAFEGGAIAKSFVDKAKKSSGSSLLPDFAKDIKISKDQIKKRLKKTTDPMDKQIFKKMLKRRS